MRVLALTSVLALAACGSEPAPVFDIPETQLQHGARVFAQCRTCHSLNEGGRNKVGPNLWGMFGRKAGARDDFNYSRAMAASDVVWSDETLDAYLLKPAEYIKGTRMSYAGLRRTEDREALIAYLRAQTGAPTEAGLVPEVPSTPDSP